MPTTGANFLVREEGDPIVAVCLAAPDPNGLAGNLDLTSLRLSRVFLLITVGSGWRGAG